MSARNGFVLLVALSALMFLGACGNNGNSVAVGTAPPSGAFSKSSLNGTYVFSASGEDSGSAPYAMAGTLTANGSGGITGGAIDINDLQTTPVANATVNNNSVYTIGADGRGTITIGVPSNPLTGNITFDFVLQDSSHGLITGFDDNYSGSGTIDLQASSPTPTGTYAFSLSGSEVTSSTTVASVAAVGNFTVGASNAISGLVDLNINGVTGSGYADETLTGGTLALGPTSTPGTTLPTTSSLATLTFDTIAIDPNHLKFIEMDSGLNLSGDAYSQTAGATIPDGNLAFTLAGFSSGGDEVAGGIIMASGGTISASSIEDFNENGGSQASTFSAPQLFSGTYAPGSTDPANSGRNVINLSGFTGGLTELAAYPSSGGVLMLEIDGTGGLVLGAGYSQSSTSFSASQGYGLNLSGFNGSNGTEIDDIAEFTADSSGTTITGVIDENSLAGPDPGITLSGTYVSPDGNGRGQISATAGNNSNSTLNGGFDLTFYTVDGTTFPFIESDASGQTATGVFVEQSPTASGSSAAKPAGAKAHTLIVTNRVFRSHALKNNVLKSNVR